MLFRVYRFIVLQGLLFYLHVYKFKLLKYFNMFTMFTYKKLCYFAFIIFKDVEC